MLYASPVFSNIGKGRGYRGVCLYYSARREFTLACQSSQEGVHGGGEVGCHVSRGVFLSLGRGPLIVSEAVYV